MTLIKNFFVFSFKTFSHLITLLIDLIHQIIFHAWPFKYFHSNQKIKKQEGVGKTRFSKARTESK